MQASSGPWKLGTPPTGTLTPLQSKTNPTRLPRQGTPSSLPRWEPLRFTSWDPMARHQEADAETAMLPAEDIMLALGKGSGQEPALGLVSIDPCLPMPTWLWP